MGLDRTAGNIIAIVLACLWTFTSQAHLTPKYTPDMADSIHATTRTIYPAFEFSGLSVEQLQQLFGTLGLTTAALLWIPQTRVIGCRAAAFVTFVVRVYPHMMVKNLENADMLAVGVSAGAAALAAVLLS